MELCVGLIPLPPPAQSSEQPQLTAELAVFGYNLCFGKQVRLKMFCSTPCVGHTQVIATGCLGGDLQVR